MDIIFHLRGCSARAQKQIHRFSVYRLVPPYNSVPVDPWDYDACVDVLCRSRNAVGGRREWQSEPFNLFRFLEQHLPRKPSLAKAGKAAIDEFFSPTTNSAVEEADKRYFLCFREHITDGEHVSRRNLAKTLAYGGYAAYTFCLEHNISTCWTANPKEARDLRAEMEKYKK